MPNLSDNELLRYALMGLEEQKKRIDEKIVELRQRVSQAGGGGATQTTASPGGSRGSSKGRVVSAEARARMAEGQRRRWAARKGEAPAAKKAGGPKKRTLSAEARARIAAAQRKRWAAVKRQKG